jgi:hypothetical protein
MLISLSSGDAALPLILIEMSEAFLKFAKGMSQEITKSDAERFFRIDDYVTGKLRIAKIERFRIIASNNQPLSLAIDFLASLKMER